MNATATVTGWQDSPSRRGTWDIIGNCAATIFTCTWTIRHLNVPHPQDSGSKRFFRTLKWMSISIILPEFILAHAIFELLMAVQALDAMAEAKLPTMYPSWLLLPRRWRKLIMGNQPPDNDEEASPPVVHPPRMLRLWRRWRRWIMCKQVPNEYEVYRPIVLPPWILCLWRWFHLPMTRRYEPTWTITHSYFANMGGFVYDPNADTGDSGEKNYRNISGQEIARLSKQLKVQCEYHEDTIKDKSKSDAFAKSLAVIQVLQLVLSLTVRKIRGLPVSQLEIVTVVFAVCGVATFISCWYKPRNVTVPLPLRIRSPPEHPEKSYYSFSRVFVNIIRAFDGRRVANDNIPIHSFHSGKFMWVLAFLSAAIGTLHAIAWNFEFPTLTERIAWRVTTIVTIVVPPLGLVPPLPPGRVPRLRLVLHLALGLVPPLRRVPVSLSQGHIAWGDPREFMEQTLRIFRQIQEGMDSSEANIVKKAYDDLKSIHNNRELGIEEKVRYKDIFGQIIEDNDLQETIYYAIYYSAHKMVFAGIHIDNVTLEYCSQYEALIGLMNGRGSARMVEEAPWTNFYPRREVPRGRNILDVYFTGIIYCLARLVLLALTVSSLRAMPDEVYTTTWTKYIPVVQ
ncbi:hypothetical protein F4678DRAFT_477684 [Xylaria arbuscula]|nr:hypothetical protein F4678DRAFT_477684 [Xylaria arbuscula]